jgi:hypothetical protein
LNLSVTADRVVCRETKEHFKRSISQSDDLLLQRRIVRSKGERSVYSTGAGSLRFFESIVSKV